MNTSQRMSSIPLTGERASNAGRENSREGVCCVSAVDVYVCAWHMYSSFRGFVDK